MRLCRIIFIPRNHLQFLPLKCRLPAFRAQRPQIPLQPAYPVILILFEHATLSSLPSPPSMRLHSPLLQSLNCNLLTFSMSATLAPTVSSYYFCCFDLNSNCGFIFIYMYYFMIYLFIFFINLYIGHYDYLYTLYLFCKYYLIIFVQIYMLHF